MSDPRERLRQYLEQRRELGESEFVLDTLSVEDALKVLTAGAAPPPMPTRTASSGATGGPSTPGANAMPSEPPARPDSAIRRAAEEAAKDGDWRAALRSVDAATPSPVKPAQSASAAPTPPAAKPTVPLKGGGPAFGPPPAGSADSAESAAAGTAFTVGAGSKGSGLAHLGDLDAVAAAIAACKGCTLSSTALNHVPGEGNPKARFVVVGEAPGATEDELGRPFVGKSGDLLTKILEAIGFKREDVFICNVLKHRPPANRNPTPEEIVACRPFLLRQLELLDAKVILALGTFAAQTLLETDSTIGKLRGIEHTYHGIPLVATYHPAALLRNPSWKRPAWEDVQLARRIFDRA
ncbi:MAG: uracil-DNA glycosylase [Gemmatimonadaceae bacterium]|nr:uracil-DNA glycosylase [Gemmatimonadaceae bacterium]